MRVLLINDVGTLHGGAETMISLLSIELIRRGHDVLVLAGDGPSSGRTLADERYRTLAGSPLGSFMYIGNPFAVYKLWRVLKTFRPDIIHLHNVSQASPFIFWLLRHHRTLLTIHDHTVFDPTRLNDVPMLVPYERPLQGYFIRHRTLRWYGERLRFWLYRRFLKHLAVALACSQFYQRCAVESHLFPRVELLPNGIVLPAQSPIVQRKHLLFVGRLTAVKGVETLVAALPAIIAQHPEVQARIVGDGDLAEILQQQIEQAGLTSHVELLGHQDAAAVQRHYAWSTAVIMPSIYPENFGLVCIEAMATGRVVVASRVGGLAELIQDGVTGYMVKAADQQSLADTVNALLALDAPDLQTMATAARETAERYAFDQYINRTLQLYASLLEQ